MQKLIGRIRTAARKLRRQYEDIGQVVPLAEAHLGGTWQRYYEDNTWFKEAEEIKDGRIYLA